MTEQDSLTGGFHQLADKSHDELLRLTTSEAISQFQTHVARSTLDYPLPDELSPHKFAEAVVEFRRNESAWNRATQSALVSADDLYKDGISADAVELLETFASSCPWAQFKDVALNQAAHDR